MLDKRKESLHSRRVELGNKSIALIEQKKQNDNEKKIFDKKRSVLEELRKDQLQKQFEMVFVVPEVKSHFKD